MNIDKDKLIEVIQNSVNETKKGYWLEECICVGHFGKMQVHVVVTKDPDNFIEPVSEYLCMSKE